MSRPERPLSAAAPGLWPARGALALAGLAVVAGPNDWLSLPFADSAFDQQRLWMLGGLAGTALALILSHPLRTDAGRIAAGLPGWAMGAAGLFFSLGLASALKAPLSIPALAEWGTYLLATAAVLTVAAARIHLGRESDGILLTLTVGGVVFYAGDFLAFYLPTLAFPDVTIFWTSPFFHFANVRFLNQFQSWTLPLLAGAVVLAGGYSRTLRALLLLVGSFWWALLLATGGRGALVATTIATLLVILFLGNRARSWVLTVLTLALGGAILYLGLFHFPGGGPGLERALSKSGDLDTGRLDLWREALMVAGEHPFLGIGPMQLARGLENPAHPHNLLLQLAAEWGLPATMAAVLLALGGVAAWARYCRRSAADMAAALPDPWTEAVLPAVTAAFLAGLGHGLVSGIAVMPVSQALAVLVTGWLLGLYWERSAAAQGTSEPPRTSRAGWGIALAGGAALIALAPALAQTVPRLPTAHDAYQDADGAKYHPRFWLPGDLCLPPWPAPYSDPACERESKTMETGS